MKIRKKFFLIWCNGLSRNMLIIITHYAIRSLLVLLHILYVPLTRIAFEVFDCQEDKVCFRDRFFFFFFFLPSFHPLFLCLTII